MADGDAANAIGLAIMTGLEKVKDLWKQMNATRDMLASHITGGTHAASAITTGTIDEARIPVLTAAKIPSLDGAKITTGAIDVPSTIRAGSTLIGLAGLNVVSTAILQAVPGTGLSGWTSVVARNSDGTIGVAVSSARFKKNIKPAPHRNTLLAAQVVTFTYKKDIDPDETPQRGLIAEELHDLGLHEYVVYDAAGAPFSLRYELLVVDLLDIVQDHDRRLAALEQKGTA